MRAIVTEINWVLCFATGEYFVDNADLHNTTFTADLADASKYATPGLAQDRADAMARTQGVRLTLEKVG